MESGIFDLKRIEDLQLQPHVLKRKFEPIMSKFVVLLQPETQRPFVFGINQSLNIWAIFTKEQHRASNYNKPHYDFYLESISSSRQINHSLQRYL